MTRVDIMAIGGIAAATFLYTMTTGQAVAQNDVARCSVSSSGSNPEMVLRFSAAMPEFSAGGTQQVLGQVHLARSSGLAGPVASFHAINTKGTGGTRQSGPSVADRGREACSPSVSEVVVTRSTCTISGTEPNPIISASLLLPLPRLSDRGVMSEDTWEVSVVSRSAPAVPDTTRVTCAASASNTRRGPPRATYDLAVGKVG